MGREGLEAVPILSRGKDLGSGDSRNPEGWRDMEESHDVGSGFGEGDETRESASSAASMRCCSR